jgi:hypothetical protein
LDPLDSWRTICISINDLPSSAKLHRALSRDFKIKLGPLVAFSGRRTLPGRGESLELTTHFPNSEVTQELDTPAAALLARRSDWRLAARVVTYRRVEWVIDSFVPYKCLGMDGLFTAFLQEGREAVIPYLVRIFSPCLFIGYIPATWRQVKIVFIPKPGRNSCSGPRDYKLIRLIFFLLKTMEKLEDRYQRDEALAQVPLHPKEHAY